MTNFSSMLQHLLLFLFAAVALGETPADRALNAAQNLQQYYNKTTGVWQPISWWGSANCMQSLADLQTVCPSCTVNPAQTDVFASTYAAHYKSSKFVGTYYDDEGWWALAWVRAYDVTKNKNYLNVAIGIFEDMLSTGYNTTCGGIWWKKTEPKKNTSIANGLFMSLAAHLANRLTNKSYYYGWAKDSYKWFQTSGVIGADCRVRDGVLTDGCTPSGGYYTYNHGVILGAIVEMNKYSADSAMMKQAECIADTAIAYYSDANGIFHEKGDNNTKNYPLPIGSDGITFKGAFIRNLGLLQEATGSAAYKEFINRQAESLWMNARVAANGSIGVNWAGPFNRRALPAQEAVGVDALAAAIRVNPGAKSIPSVPPFAGATTSATSATTKASAATTTKEPSSSSKESSSTKEPSSSTKESSSSSKESSSSTKAVSSSEAASSSSSTKAVSSSEAASSSHSASSSHPLSSSHATSSSHASSVPHTVSSTETSSSSHASSSSHPTTSSHATTSSKQSSSSTKSQSSASTANASKPFTGLRLRICPIGDSITVGKASTDGNGYRDDLRQMLLKAGAQVSMVGTQSSGYMYDGVSEGYNGGTIQQIQQNVSDHKGLTAAKPNIILLHAGTNDLVKHPGITFAPAAAPDRLQTFINWIFTQLPDAVILVAQIEEVYGNSTRTMAHRTFNKGVVSMVTDMVKEDKHVFLANNASWLTDTAADKEYFAKDGIHPNDAGYNVLAKGWYDALVKVRGIAGFIKTPADVDFNTAIFAPASTRLASTHPTSSGAHTSVPSSILYGYGNHPTSSGAHASIPSSVMYPPSSPSKSSTKAATGKASTHSEHPPVKTVTSTAHTTVTTSRAISTVPHTTLVYATVTEFVTATTKAPVRVRQLRNEHEEQTATTERTVHSQLKNAWPTQWGSWDGVNMWRRWFLDEEDGGEMDEYS